MEGAFSEYIITNDVEACIPEKIIAFVKAQIDLSEYGLNLTALFLTDFAKVRTYRLIQGDLNRYAHADIHTDNERRSARSEHVEN